MRLQAGQTGSLGFVSPKAITLGLRVPDRPTLTVMLVDAGPPATLSEGRITMPPNRDEAIIEFEIEGEYDEKVRVEVYHPDALEDVKPKLVEGFFDVARNRRLGKAQAPEPAARPASERPTAITPKSQAWTDLIEDEAYRRVFTHIAEQRLINEEELTKMLGSSTRVRVFARHFDELVKKLPFEIEIVTVQGMKAYARKG